MSKKILIVEDESMVAYDLELMLTQAGYLVSGVVDSVKEALDSIERDPPDIVLLDIFLKGRQTGIDLAAKLTAQNIAFIYLSANFQASILERAKETEPYGFLVKPFRENELLIMLDVAIYRHQNGLEAKLRQEQVLENLFKEISIETVDWELKLLKLVRSLQPYLPFDYLTILSSTDQTYSSSGVTLLRTGYDTYKFINCQELSKLSNLDSDKLREINKQVMCEPSGIHNGHRFKEFTEKYITWKAMSECFQLQSLLHFPILNSRGQIVNFLFLSRKADGYHPDHQKLLNRLNHSLITAIDDILPKTAFDLPGKARASSTRSNVKHKSPKFEGIIGDSHLMLNVLDHVAIAAPINTSILILGESGTGKERIAKSIHSLSPRKEHPLVIINCASLPSNLIESELFGHEKGAFTGASERRKGKFELADKGTIFLDEIGEMPLELQAKLLRVLQEQEIERVGGNGLIKIDVRIIAATNRDLENEVREGRFRLDLYYRLCVFPIIIPSLKERKEDIPLLTHHFIRQSAEKFGKRINGITEDALEMLQSYHWPGNIRELENYIQRGTLLCKGDMITKDVLPSFQLIPAALPHIGTAVNSGTIMQQNAKELILSALRKCNGRISGLGGAAELLGMPATTLHSKIKKLGLKKWD